MAHTHEHDHEGYFLDQLFSIALCGAFGGIAVLMYIRQAQAEARQGQPTMLRIILDPKFHPYVLAGGIALLMLVLIRAIALWKYAGEISHEHHHHDHDGPCGHENCDHDHDHHHHHDHAHGHHHHHDHDHEHDHHHHHHEHEHASETKGMSLGLPVVAQSQEHAPHTHEHGHDHDHGWAPWRYTVLMLPVVLYLLNLPNSIFSARFQAVAVEDGTAEQIVSALGMLSSPDAPAPLLGFLQLRPRYNEGPVTFGKDGRPILNIPDLRFSELEQWAFDPYQREKQAGKAVAIVGQFLSDGSGTSFNLTRYQMNCCAADAIPLKAIISVTPAWQGERLDAKARQKQWVRVIGRVYFLKMRGGKENEYAPALILFPDKDHPPDSLVEIVRQPANPYTN